MGELDEFIGSIDRWFEDRPDLPSVRARIHGGDDAGSAWVDQAALGWTSLAIPGELGGAERDLPDVGELLAACGRHLALGPFVATVGLSTPMLLAARNDEIDQILHGVAIGTAAVAVALPPVDDLRSPIRCDGTLDPALDLPGATHVILRDDDGSGGWCVVPTSAGSVIDETMLLDGHGRGRFRIEDPSAVVSLDLTLQRATDLLLADATALVAAHLLGIAEGAFGLTVAYLRDRHQFGVPIGSFQALQHRAARLHAELVVCRSTVEAALVRCQRGASDRHLHASAAKARAGALAFEVATEGIQLHGGIGMTAEADIGLYLKAARVGDQVLGHHLYHQRRAGQLLLGEPTITESDLAQV